MLIYFSTKTVLVKLELTSLIKIRNCIFSFYFFLLMPYPLSQMQDHVHVPGMPYDFEYAVQDPETANDYAHKASSDGDVVTGEYRVQMPDGRTQIVRYTADWKTGYHADVSYEGEATYPQGPQPGARGGGGGGAGGAGGYKY